MNLTVGLVCKTLRHDYFLAAGDLVRDFLWSLSMGRSWGTDRDGSYSHRPWTPESQGRVDKETVAEN